MPAPFLFLSASNYSFKYMKLFKKKKKREETRLDFSDVVIKLNVRSICYYETARGRSFFSKDFEEEDMLFLVYAMIKENNDIDLTFDGFLYMLEDERVMNWCMLQLMFIQKEALQLNLKKKEDAGSGETTDVEVKMTDIANYLIIKNKMDVRYVMNDMKLWEISNYMEAASAAYEERLSEQRLWTYLTILPNVDGKKLSGPEKLIKFPWDDKDDRKQKEFEKNAKAAMSFLGGRKDG